MTRVAFYAPMKPPSHDTPSGDREMARNLMAVIGARADVDLVSDLRVHDRRGDASFQADMLARARAAIVRITARLDGNDTGLWVTYHNYYKAPDLIGPGVCRALNLPYVQIESTRARSRLTGPWSGYAAAAEAAADAADVIFYLTGLDRIALMRDRPPGQHLVHLRPFLPLATLPAPAPVNCRTGPMLSVAMMRTGDKLASYRIIADTLGQLSGDWRLEIAGDGPARPEVAAMMARFGARVSFLGQLDKHGLARAYERAALFFWPGVNEAYGMVYLEAQGAGLAVVAQDRPGVRDVVTTGFLPDPEHGPGALAQLVNHLLNSPAERRELGRAAWDKTARHHLMTGATDTFWRVVKPLLKARR